jgi:hypothetical protein
MPFVHKLIPAILAAMLFISVVPDAARAETATPQPAALRCADGACTIQAPAKSLSPLARLGATLGWSALQGASGVLPAGADLKIDDNVTLMLPVGELTLPKAHLDVEMGDDNRIARLHGLVETPFPTLGVLSDVRMVQPALAEMGLDTGANLSRLGAPLDAERQYLFFNIASGMDMAGRVAATGDSLNLSAPAGQVLTLVIDTVEPLVYLAGNVTLNTSADMLLAGPLQELAQQSPLIPDALPLQQRTQVTVSGLAGKSAEESLKLGGAWGIDSGAVGRWLGVEARPLAMEGLLTLSAEGMLLDGVVRSSIAPDTVLDSSVQLTAFVPFQKGSNGAFVETQATLSVPLANVALDGSARLDLPSGVAETATATAGRAADSASDALQNVLATAGQAATTGADAIKDLAGRGGVWLGALPKPNLANIQLPRVLVQQ